MKNWRNTIFGASLALAMGYASAQGAAQSAVNLNIDALPIGDALNQFAAQTGLQVVLFADVGEGVSAAPLSGVYTPEAALEALLASTGLGYEYLNERTVAVRDVKTLSERASKNRSVTSEGTQTSSRLKEASELRMTRVAATQIASDSAPGEAPAARLEERAGKLVLQEIVVTGSHIRGAQNLSSPILTFDREEIERSGFATTQQFVQSLTQNFNNISDTAQWAGGSSLAASYQGSGINLRGVGGESTLVLLNGRRLASAGNGSFVDISLIPLSAIERMEVLTDGASAIYGSDAVGGVVNLILRDDFDGAETRMRYGAVTEGSHDTLQAGQILGHAWRSGQMLFSYEYHRQNPLRGLERSFFEPNEILEDVDLVPGQQRHGALATFEQRISAGMKLDADLFFGTRRSDSSYNQGFIYDFDLQTRGKQFGGAVALSADLAGDWQLRVSGALDRTESRLDEFFAASGELAQTFGTRSHVRSFDLAADGSLLRLRGGAIKFALGGQYRQEQFEDEYVGRPALLRRDIGAAYAELILPWVGQANRRAGLERLELSIAGRYEDYSDFGSTFNPKIGLAWSPHGDLNVRATWGTSFKAPLLSFMNPNDLRVQVYEAQFQDASGFTPAMLVMGSGENLGSEEATNRTLGFDFSPGFAPGLDASVTYFDIDYRDRIGYPFPPTYLPQLFTVLTDPSYSFAVLRDFDPRLAEDLYAQGRSDCYMSDGSPCPSMPALTAIVDARPRNLARLVTTGLDYSVGYRWSSDVGTFAWQLSGTHLLKNRRQYAPGHAAVDQLNDVLQPVDLRLRGGVTYTQAKVSATAHVNYTDSYRDKRGASQASPLHRPEVASWTTLDLSVRYQIDRLPGFIDSAMLSLSAVNVLDRDPPFVAGTYGLHFDGVNASPLGRFISAQLTAIW